MKKREEVSKLPRRRDAALAVPYKKDEFISPSDDKKFFQRQIGRARVGKEC